MSSFNSSNIKSADSCLSKLPCKLISKQYIDSEVCFLYDMIDCIKREYGICSQSDQDDLETHFDYLIIYAGDSVTKYPRSWCKDHGQTVSRRLTYRAICRQKGSQRVSNRSPIGLQ
ncbi:unnamed protein product [Oppiella nova]|uniref:Uncharacterized protein n=1 Tax=Oppiella nova TaxID=334625 RepID=A0A7R9M4G7_9ACAR|nr:unnamed protein product [Oppiella nova]CAG2170094.1 unnamed protein product [Oppiella nova]